MININILLVEDDDDTINIFYDALTAHGYSVKMFTDPVKAYLNFKDNPSNYDLVLSDNNMPGMSGIELLVKIKQINNDVNVLLMSGFDLGVTSSELKEIGMEEFLEKPLHIHQLLEAIRKYHQPVISRSA